MRRSITAAELEAVFESVDAKLAAESIPLHARSFLAGREVALALGLKTFPYALPGTPQAEQLPNGWIAARLYDWYQRRYGDAMNRSMDVGTIALRIRGALWVGRIRLIFGAVNLYVDRQPNPLAGKRVKKDRGNVLDDVDRLPQGLRDQLTDDELREIFSLFRLGYDAYYCLDVAARTNRMVRAAFADYSAAVEHLVQNDHPGQSKYSSLQAAEKTLKAVIAKQGGEFPRRGHPIRKLAVLAEERGLAKVPGEVVDALECGAAPRYGEQEVTVEEALDAHYAALIVARIAEPILGSGVELSDG